MMLRKDFARLRRWEQTDDVYQGAMLRLYQSLNRMQFESLREFFGLAATQVRRTLIDLARHHFGPEGEARHHDTDFMRR
jgi:RNA polymerase sigma-70 factor (ECF subfamily)